MSRKLEVFMLRKRANRQMVVLEVLVATLVLAALLLCGCNPAGTQGTGGGGGAGQSSGQTGGTAQSTQPDDNNTSGGEATGAGTGSTSDSAHKIPETAWISAETLNSLMQRGECAVFDTRSYASYAHEYILGAQNLPFRFLGNRFLELPDHKTLVFICSDEAEAQAVFSLLVDTGFDPSLIYFLKGGIQSWAAAALPLEEVIESSC